MTTPYILLPYQQRFMLDPAQVRVAQKSRRIGLTWTAGLEAVLSAAQRGGTNTLYCGYNMAMSRDFILECANFCRQLNIVASDVEETLFPDDKLGKYINAYKITFASGNRIVSLSSRPENMRGKKGNILLDEIAFMPDLEGMIKASMALTLWGGRVSMISTHSGDTNPFYQLVNDIRIGKLPYSLHTITLDDALRDGLYRRICLTTGKPYSLEAEAAWRAELFANYPDPAQADEELLCIARSNAGAYIARESIERCMADRPVLKLHLPDSFLSKREIERQIEMDQWIADQVSPHLDALPRHLRSYAGLDFARSGDLSALVVLTEREDLTYDCPFLVEMRNTPHEAQRQILFAVLGRLPRFTKICLDKGGNGSFLSEVCLTQFGEAKVEGVQLTQQFYIEHMAKMKAYIEERRVTLPRQADVLRDIRSVELINGVPKVDSGKRVQGVDGLMRHGDVAIALCLAIYAINAAEPASAALDNSDASRIKQRTERARRSHLWRGI
jgi:phage FluMu gp28-like protein